MATWTKKTPAKPGWYWHRNLRGSDIDRVPEVIYIRLYVNRLAISNSAITDSWPGGEWAGPLRLPREPKKGRS